ncbi:Predicted DNA-binding transcriptional regulator YafY, contains an HTH and WYL domains [Caloranaerobacter azorensis DSM 13643]|uniref:Predicted DNA-binding transcriptional regulator YafY, contains an HTH and WYL domains n=1 Tax=Caloranaerobacter azorensis DSM 13643 TaxID=1121264 RepID=A0A1M5W3B4_9FIRM|nr:transcriptional regulator [Caloranaerobacter azorensis]SHH81683.1 Predicted DNA-binding transcriptional regulator YafY, contains an HTH and WYL domains [Caloranaerobacter azorensis DSM 13643]
MSKVSNCLRMLILLKSRGKMKIKELAERLEVSERMIREYKNELEKAEIYLMSEPGKNGGYYLDENSFIFNLNLEEAEISSFLMAKEFLEKEDNFMFLKEYESGLDKIKAAVKGRYDDGKNQHIVKVSRPNIDLEDEKKKYLDISSSIISRNKLEINYFSINSGLVKRVIRPYVLFMYKGFWYCIGYCELRGEIRDFKLSRIRSYKLLEDTFDKPIDFKLSDYLGHNSIFKDKLYNIKLKINPPMSIIISERIWSENQKIIFNQEDNSILFEATMSGLPEIKSWILSMGSCVEILEPEELKEEIREEVKKLKNLYKIY